MHEARQPQSFAIGLLGQQIEDILHRRAQIKVDNLQLHLARFNFREI